MECPKGCHGGPLGMTPSVRSQPQPSLPTALWAAQIAAATPLPDARLNTRLQRLLTQLADKPLDAWPAASEASAGCAAPLAPRPGYGGRPHGRMTGATDPDRPV